MYVRNQNNYLLFFERNVIFKINGVPNAIIISLMKNVLKVITEN